MDLNESLSQSMTELFPARDRPMLDLFLGSFRYPSDTASRATKLAADVDFILHSSSKSPAMTQLWSILLGIATRIPPGHEWQDSLVQCFDLLRARQGFFLPERNAEVRVYK